MINWIFLVVTSGSIIKTTERSGHYIVDENTAFDKLYELVKIQEKYIKNRYK